MKKNTVTICSARPQGFRAGWYVDYVTPAGRMRVDIYATKREAIRRAGYVPARGDHASVNPLAGTNPVRYEIGDMAVIIDHRGEK